MGDNAGTTFRGPSPLIFGLAINVRNSVQFKTMFDFDCEISGTDRGVDKQ